MSWLELAGPLVLFWMMSVVGLELTVADFRRVAAYPAVVLLGTLGQWTALPLLAAALLLALELEPHAAAGVVLLTASPGGGISNVFAYLAGANVALSVTLTAVSSLLSVVTLPIVTSLGFRYFVGHSADVEVPVVAMIGQLTALVLLPIGLGMGVRARRPALATRVARLGRRLVLGALVLLMVVGMSSDQTGLAGEVLWGLVPALLWTLLAMALGLGIARLLRLDGAERFTFLIEYSVKNVGLAAIVALSGFQRPEFAVFVGAYVVTGYPLAALAAWGFRRAYAPGAAAVNRPT